MSILRWLHLSDFHIGKDKYGQIKLMDSIVEHMKECMGEGIVPEVLFVTGDIANFGKEEEYKLFSEEFLKPVRRIYGYKLKIYVVPGNHDVDRDQSRMAARNLYSTLEEEEFFFDTDENGLGLRKEIFPRFKMFQTNLHKEVCFPVEDMFTEKAYFNDIIEKDGVKIGIAGINTSWLSCSDKDKKHMTPGKFVVEEAIKSLQGCDYKILLGHHPFSWMEETQAQMIEALFAGNEVLYLHGHMHKNSVRYMAQSDKQFLDIQSGAAFQAREDEIYINSLMWGELDIEKNMLNLQPKIWSSLQQKFVLGASEMMPESLRKGDKWVFPVSIPVQKESKEVKKAKIPPGWRMIDKDFAAKQKENKPAEEEILKFFDGREPSYKDIFSGCIPVRNIVEDMKKEFVNNGGCIQCTLLLGAGGEGKTTVLLQTVAALVEKEDWKALVLKYTEEDMELPAEKLLSLTKEGNWIIAVDNCNYMIKKLHKALKEFAQQSRNNTHFMLCTRDMDWTNLGGNKLDWNQYAHVNRHKLRGIDASDAGKIVTAWSNYGEQGMGRLVSLGVKAAEKKLLEASRDEQVQNEQEGALLGAMLKTRYGDMLTNHVRAMLMRIKEVPLSGGDTLLDAFAYIVAMHAEKQYFLSKTVLAQVFHYKSGEVKKNIIRPLGDEAASAVSGDMVYARHISIAEAAKAILEEEFDYDFDEIFIDLTAAAVEANNIGDYVESLAKWQYFSDYFMAKGKKGLAIRLDQAVLKIDNSNSFIMAHLSSLYREVSEWEKAAMMFRDIHNNSFKHGQRRSLFCEWALAEANLDNRMTSICLSAIALSDQAERQWIDRDNASMNLYAIAVTFLEVNQKYCNEVFRQAARASVKIGLLIDSENEKLNNLMKEYKEELKLEGMEAEKAELQKSLCKGVEEAVDRRETDFADWVPEAGNLTYEHLFNLMKNTVAGKNKE